MLSRRLSLMKNIDHTTYSINSTETISTDRLDKEQTNDNNDEGVWSPDIEQSFHV